VLKPREVVRAFEKLGFVEVRQRGSHKQYRHADGRCTTVPFHGNRDVSPIASKTDYQRYPDYSGRVRETFMKHSPKILVFAYCSLVALGFDVRAADDANAIAARCVHLVLALGQHDLNYVDAFCGPAEWKTQADKEKKLLNAIGAAAAELMQKLRAERTTAPLAESSNGGNSGDEMVKFSVMD
jgi:predicted RNA binding protein YcfA (HicA-like mRNA interferase family)